MSPQPMPSFPLLRRDDAQNNTALTPNNSTSPTPTPEPDDHRGGFHGFWIAIVIIALLVGMGTAAFIVWRRRAVAQRRGAGGAGAGFGASNQGGPSLDGARRGLSAFWYKLRNPRERTAGAGFEGISAGRAGGRALDPDEAWDTRVGHGDDGFYGGDTELQGNTSYHGVGGTEYTGGRGMPVENPFGDEHAASRVRTAENPFGDDNAEPALRSVSPRPVIDTSVGGAAHAPAHTSPTRRSLFKEEM